MIRNIEPDSTSTSFKDFFLKIWHSKYFCLICIVLFVTAAIGNNRYSAKTYEVSASISPIQNDASSLLRSNDLFRGIESFRTNMNIENEIENLNSFALVSSTISNLNLEVGYYKEKDKLFRERNELYKNSPITVNIDKSHIQPININLYYYILNDSTFRITASEKDVKFYNYLDNNIVSEGNVLEIDMIGHFNKTIDYKEFKFSVSLNKEYQPVDPDPDNLYYFKFHHKDYLTKQYMESFKIELVSPLSSIINIRYQGNSIRRIIDFLNVYLDSYLENDLAKKNKVAKNTINFIDSQISDISDSLVLSESKLRNYRTAEQVMDLSFQGQRIYEQMTQIEEERANLEVQKRYYNYVINNFKTNNDISGIAPPSSTNIIDPIINQLISDLIDLNSQRSAILTDNSEKNLFLGQIENQIVRLKNTIIENATNNLNTLNLSLNELNYRADRLTQEISKLPRKELNMVSMERKFNLNDAIYTFLLERRSEAAITMASNYPDYEILEPARRITSRVISPKSKLNYFFALFLGLLVPTMYIFIRDFFNTRISSVNEIEHLINRSVIGSIYSNRFKSEAVVLEAPKSSISESFRNLRSNLFFKLKDKESKVILVTSSQPKDGKSFISYNLASFIALVGHKTIIIDMDLRKPKLHNKFKLDNSSGLSNLMIRNSSIDDEINKTSFENLFFIPAGPIMPNPSELIEAGVLDDLIATLRTRYDYIVIDSSPLGLVADASLLMKYASQILLITRNNYTQKDVLINALELLKSNNFDNYDIVYNDINFKKSPYGNYPNYYT